MDITDQRWLEGKLGGSARAPSRLASPRGRRVIQLPDRLLLLPCIPSVFALLSDRTVRTTVVKEKRFRCD